MGVVVQCHGQSFMYNALFEGRRGNGRCYFNAAEEVAPHPVCAGNERIVRAIVVEAVNP